MGSQNWQNCISNGCVPVHPLFKWDLCVSFIQVRFVCSNGGKNGLRHHISNHWKTGGKKCYIDKGMLIVQLNPNEEHEGMKWRRCVPS